MNRREMIAAIRADHNKEFQFEISYYMDIEGREYPYDEVSALFDLQRACEEHSDKDMMNVCRRVLISIGYYRPMSQSEIDDIEVFRNGRPAKPWDFKVRKIPYTTDEIEDDWFSPPEEEVPQNA